MPPKRVYLPLISVAALLLACIWLVAQASAGMSVNEMDLNPDGAAYEINPDEQGAVWISDYGAGEIWQVDAAGVTTVYTVSGGPSDARRHGSGDVWFADAGANKLRRLSPTSQEVTTWEIPGTWGLYGTAIDSAGSIWATDGSWPRLYRFLPSSRQLCTYTLPNNAKSQYVIAQDQTIWLGDWVNGRILRLEPGPEIYTYWDLPAGANPAGLALDSQGYLWWADSNRSELGRLEPGSNRLTRYGLPYGEQPQMVAAAGDLIYYTELQEDGVGILDLSTATGRTSTPARNTLGTTAYCSVLPPGVTGTVETTTGTASWTGAVYPTAHQGGGWSIYQLPDDSEPWGVAVTGLTAWIVDSGRQVLARVGQEISLTACKLTDGDGDLGTTGDQVLFEGWPVYLVVDGVRQEPSQLTGEDGCTTWSALEPEHRYGLEEDLLPDWSPLTPPSHEFDPIAPGTSVAHTFVNTRGAGVKACKLADGDGNPNTTGDQTPLQGWTVYLVMDGQRQEPGQVTGADGCTAWSALAPGHSYGVEEDDPPGWTALTATSHEFGILDPEASVTHTFVNAESVGVTACKVADGDGKKATTGDQVPIEDWTVYLVVDGQRQEPGVLTGPEGCYTWIDLEPAARYGVEEDLPAGWTALVPDSHDFGPPSVGQSHFYRFVNAENVAVTACKLADSDGDPETTGDQAPRAGWTMHLWMDGQQQEPGQATGGDGCTTWSDLAPGHNYAVEEDDPPDWTALGGAQHDFGLVVPGTSVSHDFVNAESVEVTACKLADSDGDPETTGDRAPVEAWTVYLLVDDQRQEPGQATGSDGCTTWSDLDPGYSYGVEEDDPSDWTPLGDTEHDFGPIAPGGSASHDFVNAGSVEVTACKLADDDGDPASTGDQAPLAGWTVYLLVDGQRQQPGQSTAGDGCTTWSDLDPGYSYGVEEDDPSDWTPLGDTEHDFGPIAPGGSASHAFVNAESVEVTACKLADDDGNPETTEDQAPLAGWTMYLLVDSQRQEPAQSTEGDGCTTWSDLPPGGSYGVEEEDPPGWTPLGAAVHDLDPLAPGGSASHTFVNAESVEVTACKYEDLTGDGLTADDVLYAGGWQISLLANGQVIETRTTGASGCTTWDDLGLLPEGAYGVREAERTGWLATEPLEVEFEPPVLGDTFWADFANFHEVHQIFLPLVVRQ